MGTVVTIPEAALDYAIYGDNSHTVSNYLSLQMQQMPQMFNAIATKVYNAMMTSYNYVNDAMTKHRLIGTLQTHGIMTVENYISPLTTIEQLQQASPVMQRWIMSHPEVRQLYLKQNIDGYSDSYHNVFGKKVGEEDYNYRRVMDGVLQDNGKESFTKFYEEELVHGDRKPEHPEKVAILTTYDAIDAILRSSDIDFTCNSTHPSKINRE